MQLDFNFIEHLSHQNNHESQKQIEDGMKHFSGQNQKVYEHLMQGLEITGMAAKDMYSIQHINPRIAAIKKVFDISERKIPNSNGTKVWFMTTEQIENNKSKLLTLKK